MDHTFLWKDRYTVKVPSLDEQHKKLFQMARELYDATGAGQGKDALAGILQRLVEYTVHHFSTEERLMRQYGFPGLTAHLAEHKALTDQVLELKKQVDGGDTAVVPKLMSLLQQWLRNHIQQVDAKYGDFLSAKGVK